MTTGEQALGLLACFSLAVLVTAPVVQAVALQPIQLTRINGDTLEFGILQSMGQLIRTKPLSILRMPALHLPKSAH